MIAIPAIDLREGACVQLVGGSYADERVRIADPAAVARRWRNAGFMRLHIVDLDAATGTGDNASSVTQLIEGSSGVQVGGGIRSTERIRELIDTGADRVIVGTRAIEDPRWLARIAATWPSRIVVAADVRGRSVVTHGWGRESDVDVLDLAGSLAGLPLAGVLVTAVHREGRLIGTDLGLMAEIASGVSAPLIASGGITTVEEMRLLAGAGVAAAVLGMSLYTGALDPVSVAEEFG
jgi:phosphoribosylformimino-5-aminoimidazole carboxamide ribotide isomerase